MNSSDTLFFKDLMRKNSTVVDSEKSSVQKAICIIFTKPTQPPTLSGTGNEYRLKGDDALRLGSKGRMAQPHSWMNVWVAGKTV